VAIVARDQEKPRREWTIRVTVFYAITAAAILIAHTIQHRDEVGLVLSRLDHAPFVVGTFVVFAFAVSLLKFKLTDKIFVSFIVPACTAMAPLLGGVLCAWIAVGTAIICRILAINRIGPIKYDGSDFVLEYARAAGLFMVYGVPILVASAAYNVLGGAVPLMTTTGIDALRIAAFGVVVSAGNTIVMAPVQKTFGYRWSKILHSSLIDVSIYTFGLPYVIGLVFSEIAVGWPMLVGLAFAGVLTNALGRRLTQATDAAQRQLERATSLTAIGNAISLELSEERFFVTLYEECARVIDVANFTIAIVDDRNRELLFRFKMRDGVRQPAMYSRPLGLGYNSWVVEHRQPLRLLRKGAVGVAPVNDGFESESWMGVPMLVRDRVIGVISVQSRARNAYSMEDELLLMAIGNQAAVAVEHAQLYRDLEVKVRERTIDLASTVRALEASGAELTALNQISHVLTTTEDLDSMLQQIAAEMATALGTRNIAITLLTPEKDELFVAADYALEPNQNDTTGMRVPIDSGAASSVVRTRHPTLIENPQHDRRMTGFRELLRQRGVQSLLLVPLITRNEVIGTIAVDVNRLDRSKLPAAKRLAVTIAGQIAGAIERSRLYADEHRSREVAEHLEAAARVLSESLDLDVVLPAILDQLREVIEYDSAAIHMLEDNSFRVLAVRGLPESEIGRVRNISDHEYNAHLVRDSEPFIYKPRADAAHWSAELFKQIRCNMGVPLVVRDRVIGALTIDSHQPDRYGPDDLKTARIFARHAALAIENAKLYSSAQRATLAKSQFLANMSHEIRTPLNAILGFVQLMMRNEQRDADDQQNLGIIMRSGHHLLNLINDVLSVAKIEAGLVALSETTFDPHALFTGLRETFAPRASAKQLDLLFEISNDVPAALRGDESKLRQILYNLLGNAFKFTPSGAVTLRARWSDGVAHLEVQDTGCGLTEEEIAVLFRPFVQTESGVAAREGTGLGLAICRSYVQLMHGEIGIRSVPGRGSTFYFEVPLPRAEEEQQVPAPVRKVVALAPGQPHYRMLVADDTVENRILLEKLLATFGFEVRSAMNGREALDTWSEWKPDLVWMDIRMPIVDGYEATRRIREAEQLSGKHTPVIAITASAFEHDKERILAAGCDDMVVKPFVEENIFTALSRHLGVEWQYADEEPRVEPARLSAARLAQLPRAALEKLREAVTAGDIDETYNITNEIERIDPQVAEQLRTMLKNYRLDEIQAAVER